MRENSSETVKESECKKHHEKNVKSTWLLPLSEDLHLYENYISENH